jgi:predicted CXXCH cytochrome family protein
VTRLARRAPRPRAAGLAKVLAASLLALGFVGGLGAPVAQAAAPASAASASLPTAAAATPRLVMAGSSDPVHGPYGVTTDTCARCHRAHTGQAASMTTYPSHSQLCLTCHDGTGSSFNVSAQYSDQSIPANDPATRSYYSHDPNDSDAHTLAVNDEFTGVQNRHSECIDCHNAHAATTGKASQATVSSPWKPSGALAAISGLSVVNGPAGDQPTYTFVDGQSASLTAEYQLCFKCHSGNTILLSNAGLPPSQYELDKAVEFNPANASFHPVEAIGTNQSTAMQKSLSDVYGSRRRWALTTTSTVRCTNCHTGGPAVTSSTAIDGDQPVHVSANRGILIAPYLDRVLVARGKPWNAADFALCFSCHSERPFTTNTPAGTTNFVKHRFHVAGIGLTGTGGLSIDTPGDGQGNALCAECHFRLHSTAFAVGTQPYKRLVNFAPDVQPYNGSLTWVQLPPDSQGNGHGTCTLVCHGAVHNARAY